MSSSSHEHRSVSTDINLSGKKWTEKEKEQILAGSFSLNHHKTGLMFTKVVTVATKQPSAAHRAHTNPHDTQKHGAQLFQTRRKYTHAEFGFQWL